MKADNLLAGFENSTVVDEYIRRREADPPRRKEGKERPVYQSQSDFGDFRKATGDIQISDFSLSILGGVSEPLNHDIQPQEFSAREVLMRAEWTYSADIWNLGMLVGYGAAYNIWHC